jgi:hypothetical protein
VSSATETAEPLALDGVLNAPLLWWLALGVACAVLLIPLAMVQAPPLLDFLNHMARIAILADNGANLAFARMYSPHWAIIPNLGLDILLTPLMRVISPLVAGRIAAAVVLLLPVVGTIVYSRAAYRRWSYWPLGVCLVAYNAPFLLGFMNFLAGVGFAMLLAASWISWRDRYPVATVWLCSLGMVGLFFCHLMGVVFALTLIGAFELDWIFRRPRAAAWRLTLAVPLLIGPGILYLLAPWQTVSAEALRLPIRDKALQLLVPFIGYYAVLDLVTAAVVGLCLAALAVGGCLRISAPGAIALSALFALYLVTPFIAKGVYFVDTRIAIMLGYLLFGAVMPVSVSPRVARAIAVVIVGLFVVRSGTNLSVWLGYQQDIDGMRAAISAVQPGQRVFEVSVTPDEAPNYWRNVPRNRMLWTGVRLDYHLAALVSLEHHAFWPYLFADPSQQPIVLLPPYKAMAEEAGSIAPHRQLDVATTPLLCPYDYLLLLGAGGEPDLVGYGGSRLLLLQSNEVAALYTQPIAVCGRSQVDRLPLLQSNDVAAPICCSTTSSTPTTW